MNTMVRGGTPFSGFDIGILLLDTTIPRPPGDVGHAATYPFPVLFEIVPGADPRRVVDEGARGLLDAFIAAAHRLVDRGVCALATSCGFLAIYQRELAAAVPVPVATSSLLQIPLVLGMLRPDERVGVITIDATALDDRHFRGAGVRDEDRSRLTVVGLERTAHLYPALVQGRQTLDLGAARAEVVAAARDLVTRDPTIGAFVFECTNLPPYAAAVQATTGRPVFDAVTLVTWLHDAVCRPWYSCRPQDGGVG
ncbi:MAG: aspartate/glutamate racemase family protein [Thermomicrobiales bacterium]